MAASRFQICAYVSFVERKFDFWVSDLIRPAQLYVQTRSLQFRIYMVAKQRNIKAMVTCMVLLLNLRLCYSHMNKADFSY